MLDVSDETLERRRGEVAGKITKLRQLMWRRGVDALHLTTIANTAWLTAGAATYVDESAESAACSFLVTADEALVLTDPIEEPRLRAEERLDALGFDFVVEPWYARGPTLWQRVSALRVGADTPDQRHTTLDLSGDLVALRSLLTEGEQARLREGARRASSAMWAAIRGLAPGMTEFDVAAALTAASRTQGGTATVTLVGSDQRISEFRHPLPTGKAIERYVMLVLCFRYGGLVSALTRSVTFGKAPDTLRMVSERVARVDAQMIAGTQPGRTLGAMFEVARQAYQQEGAPEAIEQHHQGGTIAYRGRETLARPGSQARIEIGHAFAWNPSLRGAKSEDTILLTAHGPEIITAMDDWPTLSIETAAGAIARPAILELPA